mmetsp:Transcript_52836/g.155660  ORF Transcript_52836/g.155660 Transcript_52836/m.155660 type:complete len:248 (-) Transcript_52836:1195-1938(-)
MNSTPTQSSAAVAPTLRLPQVTTEPSAFNAAKASLVLQMLTTPSRSRSLSVALTALLCCLPVGLRAESGSPRTTGCSLPRLVQKVSLPGVPMTLTLPPWLPRPQHTTSPLVFSAAKADSVATMVATPSRRFSATRLESPPLSAPPQVTTDPSAFKAAYAPRELETNCRMPPATTAVIVAPSRSPTSATVAWPGSGSAAARWHGWPCMASEAMRRRASTVMSGVTMTDSSGIPLARMMVTRKDSGCRG